MFPLGCFHSKQLSAFRLSLRNKSEALRLASLALPLSLTSASASVRFPTNRKHRILFQKRPASRPFLKGRSGAFRLASLVVPLSVLLLFCFHYLASTTLFHVVVFHSKKTPPSLRFVDLPLSVTSASASVRF